MKVTPFYMSKKMMINSLTRRNNRLAKQRVRICDDLPKQNSDSINQIRLSLAKFARRNDCRLSFENGEKGTVVNIERPHTHWCQRMPHIQDNDVMMSYPHVYTSFEKDGALLLPESVYDNNILGFIKKGVKEVLENLKNEKTPHVHIHKIF